MAKVLFLAPQPFFRIRGIAIAHLACLDALTQLGLSVDVLTLPFGDDIKVSGARIIRIPRLPGVSDVPIGPSLAKAFMDAVMLPQLIFLLADGRRRIVQASEESVILAAALKPIFGYKLVYDMDDVLSDRIAASGFVRSRLLLAWARAVESWAIRSCDAVVVNSEDTLRRARSCAADPSRVFIYDHLPSLPGKPLPERIGELQRSTVKAEHGLTGGPLIAYAGNLEPYQGIELLLKSLPSVFAAAPNARCLIIGGEQRQIAVFAAKAARLGVGDRVHWLGKRPIEETFRIIQAADVLAAPANQPKALPMKLYSYLFSGVPIVATALANHTQLLDEETALLVEPSADAFAAGILRVLNDPGCAERLVERARELWQNRIEFDGCLNTLRRVYELLGANPRLKGQIDCRKDVGAAR